MTSLYGLLSIARDGLAAQTAGMDTTGQNVANVNTPGYSRVTVNLETTQTGDTFAGSVQVGGVIRSYNQFTAGNLLSEQGKSGSADARSQALTRIQATVAPGAGGISDGVNALFSSFTVLEGSPSDTSTRAAVLQKATDLAQNVSTTAAALSSQKSALLASAQSVAGALNAQLSQIAKLNGAISQARGQGSEPTDLENQRDGLVGKVSTEIGAQVLQDSSGGYTVLSSGTALVSGNAAASVSVEVDSAGKLQIMANQPGGAANDITANTNAGTLGGLREARDTDLASASSQLDQFAYDLSTAVNAVHSAGYGLDGTTGRNLFTQPATVAGAAYAFSVDPGVAGQPSRIAASGTAADVPGGNDVAVKLAQLATKPLAGGSPPTQSYAAIASGVGSAMSSATAESALRTQTVTQAQDLNQSSSGVSLDEEMARMAQFQSAYQASAKIIQTVEQLLQTLMQVL